MSGAPRKSCSSLVFFAALSVVLATEACRNSRSLDEIEAVRGAAAPAPVTEASSGGTSLEAGFSRVRRIFAPDSEPIMSDVRITLKAGEFVDRVLELEVGHCYSLLAFGEPANFDVDFELMSPDGQTRVADRAPDPFPVIADYCPTVAGKYNLRIRAASGTGELMYGGYEDNQAERVAAGQRLDALRTKYHAASAPLGPVQRVWLAEGKVANVPVAMLPAHCYSLAGVGTEGVGDFDLELIDPEGEIIARDLGTDESPIVVRFCPERAAAYRARWKMYSGQGTIFWQAFSESTR